MSTFTAPALAPAPAGTYRSTQLQSVYYGPGCLGSALPSALEGLGKRKALVLTGKSLATKTDVITQVQTILGAAYGATFTEIGEHAPVAGIKKAVRVMRDVGADVIVAVGGGSPIDAGKAIAHFLSQDQEKALGQDEKEVVPIVAVPTTLSVAETTQNAGFTSEEGHKSGVSHASLVPRVIIYDAQITLHTPERLWLSTGMRALDHAIEFLYRHDTHPLLRNQALGAVRDIFSLLPLSKANPSDLAIRQRLQLACLTSLWPESRAGALGLSHGLGHKLGATYAIGHGITSCLTLAPVIALTARNPDTDVEKLAALADALPHIPAPFNKNPAPLGPSVGAAAAAPDIAKLRDDGEAVARAVQDLVDHLGLHSTLKGQGVPRQDIPVIATRVTGEDKKNSPLWTAIKGLLEGIYE